jgi:hypothetical protein
LCTIRAISGVGKLRTTKPERGFEIQPHLEEHALHWKVSESHKASPPRGKGGSSVRTCSVEGDEP